jgi:hypothetical protein
MKPRRFFFLLTVILLLGVFAFLVVTQRGPLVEARNAADSTFSILSPTLEVRYKTIPSIISALNDAGAQDRGPSLALAKSEKNWLIALNGESANRLSDVANSIEGNVSRVKAMYLGSDRLRQTGINIDAALKAFDDTLTAQAEVQIKKNAKAVAAYRSKRGAWLSKPVVFVGGFDERITFELVRTQAKLAPLKPAKP